MTEVGAVSFSCVKHPMTMGEYICGECGHQFCPECVVFPFGTAKPPLCIACALELGGVRRQSTGRPKLSRKSVRERLALQRQVQHDNTVEIGADGTAEPNAEDPWMDGEVRPDDVPGGWSESYP